MNKDDIKRDLFANATALMNAVDEMLGKGMNNEMVDLLDRALNVGRITILYFEDLDITLAEDGLRSVTVANRILGEQNVEFQDALCSELRSVVEPLENIYREKRYLLDDVPQKSMAA